MMSIVWTLLSLAAAPAPAGDPLPRARETEPSWMQVRDDPRADGWGTEVFNNVAGKQLGKLAACIENEDDPSTLAAETFSAATPYRAGLAVVYERGPIRVRRPADGPPATADEILHGSAGFNTVLATLLEPLRGARDRHAKFKVIEIPGPGTTRVLFEASGTTAGGSVQISSTWLCDWTPDVDAGVALLRSIVVESHEVVDYRSPQATMFSDCTESVLKADRAFREQLGFGNEYWMRRMQAVLGIDNYGHHGLAVADIDGDGLEDLYVCQTGGMPNLLYLQNPDGSAREVSAAAGVDFMERTHAVLAIDLDNDGDEDLVLATERALLFLANDGKGKFTIAAQGPTPSAYSLAAADYDGDADLDVYATAYVAPSEWDRQGGLGLHPLPYQDANNGAPNALYRNDGDWTFTDVTAEVGLDVANRRWSFAAAWADYDNDGDADLYVANDFGRNNLYRNDDGRFVDVAAEAGVEDTASGMSVDWGDYDGDGLLDIYVGNMFSSAGNRIVPQAGFQDGVGESVRSSFRRFARGNTLYRNNGDGSFDDVSEAARVTMGRWAWSSPFVDINNDGWEDLVVANGYVTNENSGDL